ncbi:MAG: DUF262 domain-containing protein [Firmicutes bacterium]|nr:DUF262 domain-containing protein [Bacillota bacterium]
MNAREYTFQNLFGSTFVFSGKPTLVLSEIEIPIIQRDYAQGRTKSDVKRVREKFLDALFHSITNGNKLTLDFIYGDISEKGVLTPLDGQQRLTTLFLLHWYIAKHEGIESEKINFLNRFSYATRHSSRDFCKELIQYTPDFNNDDLSTTIIDQHWYPYEWKNDPTIQSMLVMIDAIHEKFNNTYNLWESLANNVRFYFLPLLEMGFTEDLYIKMNSRGKPLSPFEHFKAEFEKIVKENYKDLSDEINRKLDIDWTRMLWKFRDENNIIDNEFMRYFRFISDIICYKSDMVSDIDEFKLAEKIYGAKNENHKENIEYLKNSFDCWLQFNIEDFFKKFFSGNKYQNGKVTLYNEYLNVFNECCKNYGDLIAERNRKFPLNKTLLLFSVLTYLLNKQSITEENFRRRIRIIRNLIWNSQDEIRDERMKILLNECETIITKGDIPVSEKGLLGFNENQKREELDKLDWLKANTLMEDELFQLEDHALLAGCISIVGLENVGNFTKFRTLFDNCSKDAINTVLLSIGDYSQLVSWRFQTGARYNNSVWFNLFHPTKQRQNFYNTSKYLNQLLYQLEDSEINDETLKTLARNYLNNPDTTKDWRYYCVKYEQMRTGNFGMYYWKNDTNHSKQNQYEVIMMNTEKSLGGKNWEIFSYTLYHCSEFAGKLALGNFACQGDKLKIVCVNAEIECLNDKFVVLQDEQIREYQISQSEAGIDLEDRIEKGKDIIRKLLISDDISD